MGKVLAQDRLGEDVDGVVQRRRLVQPLRGEVVLRLDGRRVGVLLVALREPLDAPVGGGQRDRAAGLLQVLARRPRCAAR